MPNCANCTCPGCGSLWANPQLYSCDYNKHGEPRSKARKDWYVHYGAKRQCQCGKYWYKANYSPVRVSNRKRMLTHVRSAEGRKRHNAKRNDRKKRRSRFYPVRVRYLTDIVEVGPVPAGRYEYHKNRYLKAGRPFILKQAFISRLKPCRKGLPPLVMAALLNIYSNRVVTRKPPKVARRTPRQRTRSANIERLKTQLEEVENIGWSKEATHRFNMLNQAIEEEENMRSLDYGEERHIEHLVSSRRDKTVFPYTWNRP